MAEESAVNYWEVIISCFWTLNDRFIFLFPQKYGHVAFDSSQKAVFTSCVLRYNPVLNVGSGSPVISKAFVSGLNSLFFSPEGVGIFSHFL
jgi:hypothetical protein